MLLLFMEVLRTIVTKIISRKCIFDCMTWIVYDSVFKACGVSISNNIQVHMRRSSLAEGRDSSMKGSGSS